MFDDYEDYRLIHGDDDDSDGYSGDGCMKFIFWFVIIVIILSLF